LYCDALLVNERCLIDIQIIVESSIDKL